MKTKSLILAVAITLIATVNAQVASHAPSMKAANVPSASTSQQGFDRPIVKVNGTALTQRDVIREMQNIFPYARQHGGQFPKDKEPLIREQALQNVVFEELVYQEALRRKMIVPAAKLNGAVADFKKQFDSPAEFQEYLKNEQGGSMKSLREKITRAILIDNLLRLEVKNKSRVSDLELRKFYDSSKSRFQKPESVSIQTISIVVAEGSTKEQKADARRRAEDALKKAKATKNYEEFGMLAEKVSEDDWRVMMGDHKSIHRGRMPAPVEKAVFSMKPGEVSDLIDTGDSLCIARVNSREETKLVPFEEVRPSLKSQLEVEKEAAVRKNFEAKLKKNSKIEPM
jgi:parvulin-like peptidyl-prolyl isomerase